MARIKILIAGDPASIHTNRFVSLLQEIGYDVRIFQSEEYYWQEEHLRNTVVYVSSFAAAPVNNNVLKVTSPCEMSYHGWLSFIHQSSRKLSDFTGIPFQTGQRKCQLEKVIRGWRPDIIFSLKMQNDGYTVSGARDLFPEGFGVPWVHFNWGTDIEFFGKHPDYAAEHLPRIRKILAQCDFHVADCKRDARQAIELGFRGTSLGDCLANGGFDLAELRGIRREAGDARDVILVKGREGGFVGKAFNVLTALHRISKLLSGYRIKIIMPTENVRGAADFLSRLDGIAYEVVPRLPYRDLLALFARSRIAISASDVDGTPSFLTESMAMGALPIHSDMESVREWVTDGVNGLLFPVDDVDSLGSLIERALADDQLVEQARVENWKIAEARMDRDKIREHVRSLVEGRILP
jgi:glycosyltransferase involved in cell wall biosynthesis